MRLFWKVFAVLWIATLLVGGSGFLVSRALQQDWLLLQFHPQLKDFAQELTDLYENQGPAQAQDWLAVQREANRLRAQLYSDAGQPLLAGTLPQLPRFAQPPAAEKRSRSTRHGRMFQLAWSSAQADYHLSLFVPAPELFRWQRTPLALLANIALAMFLLAIVSLLLSRYLTSPLRQLGLAAQSLAQGRFESDQLNRIGRRRDEIGDLSRHFNQMGERVQSLLDSQRQLMRDISHELRSPLARLRVGLALGNRKVLQENDPLWLRLDRECSRLDALIEDILTLSRLDSQDQPAEPFPLDPLVSACAEDTRFVAEDQKIELRGATNCQLLGWPDQLGSAVDNLLRNALRFSAPLGLIRITLQSKSGSMASSQCQITIEDDGPGVEESWLSRLGEPFLRLPGQTSNSGHGLGLAIARRAISMHGGKLTFSRSELGGLKATIDLPAQPGGQL
ncbi:sensor histidine kinase [Halopseudomonas salina]|uniref:histidine kinase n=1 Tax=Halopseudomonas salina TaxID=1323744 RepID=A0ABQ1P0Y9_9GAMM|nr:HAMP domain-containing sensor histidine kinase [Halopseudomonas salina]GGC88154.1 two-component sensor histidine kinase [Halopseudomonas salina]